MNIIFDLGHLTKMATMPIYGINNKLTLTYLNIIKEIR